MMMIMMMMMMMMMMMNIIAGFSTTSCLESTEKLYFSKLSHEKVIKASHLWS